MNFYYLILVLQIVFVILSISLCLTIERHNTAVSTNAIEMKDWIKSNYIWSLFTTVEQNVTIPTGLVVGKKFIAWCNMNQVSHAYSSETVWDIWFCYRWSRPNTSKVKDERPEMTILKKIRPHLGAMYEKLKIACVIIDKPEFSPIEQTAKDILKFAQNSKKKIGIFNCIALLTGPSGKGKSHITKYLSRLLAYKSIVVEDFDPTSPAQSIEMIINEAKASVDKPLIVMLTEVDKIIDRFHTGKIQPHTNFTIQVREKDSWNALLDYMCFIDNCIVIMTTNKPYDHFNSLDPSYLRQGRVHKIYNFGGDTDYEHQNVKNVEIGNVAQIVLNERSEFIC